MHFTKTKSQQEEPINFYEELFAKKTNENSINKEKEPENKLDDIVEDIEKNKENNVENKMPNINILDGQQRLLLSERIKSNFKKIKLKYLVTGLLMGVIVNISMTHYQDINTQHLSQKFATGLMYNLSETNDLEQMAKNIYLGMKENGWEPTVKISNSNIFAFELENGGKFTITKTQDITSTQFHVEITDFSSTMVKALMIQLEPTKIGGTKNFITNKRYDASKDKISFDLEKVGQGSIPTLEGPLSIPSYPPLSRSELNLPSLPPPIISVPVSPELEGVLTKKDNEALIRQMEKTNQEIKEINNSVNDKLKEIDNSFNNNKVENKK